MEAFLKTLFEISLAMSAVIAVLLLAGRLLGKRYLAGMRYAAWLLVALRLVIPVNISIGQPVVEIAVPEEIVFPTIFSAPNPESEHTVSEVDLPANDSTQNEYEPMPTQSPLNPEASAFVILPAAPPEPEKEQPSALSLDPWVALFSIYLIGAAAVLITAGVKSRRLSRYLRRWRTSAPEWMQEGNAPVYLVPGISGPMVAGLLRPAIYLPDDLYEPESLSLILAHERTHWKNKDLWGRLLFLLSCAMHWFNPLVWVMSRRAEQDMEQRCDEQVTRTLSAEERAEYGQTILDAMLPRKGVTAPLTTAFRGSQKAVAARMRHLMQGGKQRGIAIFVAVAVCVTSLAALVSWSPQGEQPAPIPDTPEAHLEAVLTFLYAQPQEDFLNAQAQDQLAAAETIHPSSHSAFVEIGASHVMDFFSQHLLPHVKEDKLTDFFRNNWSSMFMLQNSLRGTIAATDITIVPDDGFYKWSLTAEFLDEWGESHAFAETGSAQFDEDGKVQYVGTNASELNDYYIKNMFSGGNSVVAERLEAVSRLMYDFSSFSSSYLPEEGDAPTRWNSRAELADEMRGVFGDAYMQAFLSRAFDGTAPFLLESEHLVYHIGKADIDLGAIGWQYLYWLDDEPVFRITSFDYEKEIRFEVVAMPEELLIGGTNPSYWYEMMLIHQDDNWIFQPYDDGAFIKQGAEVDDRWYADYRRQRTPGYHAAERYFETEGTDDVILSAELLDASQYDGLMDERFSNYRVTRYQDGTLQGAYLVCFGEPPYELIVASSSLLEENDIYSEPALLSFLLEQGATTQATDLNLALETTLDKHNLQNDYQCSAIHLVNTPKYDSFTHWGVTFHRYTADWEFQSGDTQPSAELWDAKRGWTPGAWFRPVSSYSPILLIYSNEGTLVYLGTERELADSFLEDAHPGDVVTEAERQMEEGVAQRNRQAAEQGYQVIDSRITNLSPFYRSDPLLPDGRNVVLYNFEYEMLIDNPEHALAALAGGASINEEGWLSSGGMPYSQVLYFAYDGTSYEWLSTGWKDELYLSHGFLYEAAGGIVGYGERINDPAYVALGRQYQVQSWLEDALENCFDQMVGGGVYRQNMAETTDENGVTWLEYSKHIQPIVPGARVDSYWVEKMAYYCSKDIYESFFNTNVYTADSIYKEEDGKLFVHSDAAAMVGWNYDLDMSTIQLLDYTNSETFRFTLRAQNRTTKIMTTLRFTVENHQFTELYQQVT